MDTAKASASWATVAWPRSRTYRTSSARRCPGSAVSPTIDPCLCGNVLFSSAFCDITIDSSARTSIWSHVPAPILAENRRRRRPGASASSFPRGAAMASRDTPNPLSRRRFLHLGGAALGAAAAAPILAACGSSSSSSSGKTELTFASAKFFGKSNIGQIVDQYNSSQTKIHVTYRELPPPSSSTDVHQQLVQSLGRGDGSVDVFTQDVIWIAEFANAGG